MMPDAAGQTDRDAVQDDGQFAVALAHFIDAAVAGARPRATDPAFAAAYRTALTARAQANADAVAAFQTASIEKIVLRWLLLASIKWDPLGIVFESFGGDTAAVIRARRVAYAQASGPADAFAADAADDELFARELALRQRWFGSVRTVHVSLQPATTELAIDGRPFRTDLYFWSPAVERFALVAECAGFQPRAAPAIAPIALPTDLLAMRLAGIDLFRDPVGAVLKVLHAAHHELVDRAGPACRAAVTVAGEAM